MGVYDRPNSRRRRGSNDSSNPRGITPGAPSRGSRRKPPNALGGIGKPALLGPRNAVDARGVSLARLGHVRGRCHATEASVRPTRTEAGPPESSKKWYTCHPSPPPSCGAAGSSHGESTEVTLVTVEAARRHGYTKYGEMVWDRILGLRLGAVGILVLKLTIERQDRLAYVAALPLLCTRCTISRI